MQVAGLYSEGTEASVGLPPIVLDRYSAAEGAINQPVLFEKLRGNFDENAYRRSNRREPPRL